MDKLTMAHDWAMVCLKSGLTASMEDLIIEAWKYADAMQAESEKRNKAEVEKKRKEIREMLNAPNTFVEREGQNFDDVEEWQPDWSQAPEGYNYFCVGSYSGNGYFCHIEPIIYKDHHWFTGEDVIEFKDHGYQGNWKDSLRKRPEPKCEVDWRQAPSNAFQWQMIENEAYWRIEIMGGLDTEPAPSFGFKGTHIVERPHGF